MSPKRLGVWLGDIHVATLDVKRPWDLRCRYERSIVADDIANRPLLSCSLPVTRQSAPAAAWVRGLLPEGNHLLSLATRARVPTNYYADLLERWPNLRPEFAMSVHGSFGQPSVADFIGEGRRWGLGGPTAERIVNEMVSDLRGALVSCEHAAVAELVTSRLDWLDRARPVQGDLQVEESR